MSKFWNENTKKIKPYVPGEQPQDKKYIKLNTNESPYPPSPKVMESIMDKCNEDLRLYPDPDANLLKKAVAKVYGIEENQVFTGNGSDEILPFCFQAFFGDKGAVLFPDITYSFYKVYADLFQTPISLVNLKDDLSIPVEEFCKANGGVLIANPNAPTGLALSAKEIEIILKNNPDSVVIVDEAYVDFGAESVVGLIKNYPNLLVVHTLSKSRCLAGLRVGMAMGNEDLIQGLNKVKNSFNSYTLDRLAISGAVSAINDIEYFETTVNKIICTREETKVKLLGLGFNVLDSKANFLFVTHPKIDATKLFIYLKENGILVRHFKLPRIEQYLRITIGTAENMNALIEEIQKYISL